MPNWVLTHDTCMHDPHWFFLLHVNLFSTLKMDFPKEEQSSHLRERERERERERSRQRQCLIVNVIHLDFLQSSLPFHALKWIWIFQCALITSSWPPLAYLPMLWLLLLLPVSVCDQHWSSGSSCRQVLSLIHVLPTPLSCNVLFFQCLSDVNYISSKWLMKNTSSCSLFLLCYRLTV